MKELFEIIGVSGYERNIREYIRQQFPTGDDCITYVDNVGNLIHIKYRGTTIETDHGYGTYG